VRSIPRGSVPRREIVAKPSKMGDKTPVVISDDERVNKHDEGPNEPTVVTMEKKKDDELEVNEELPDWFPNGWTMEIYHAEDGILNRVSLILYMQST
jgi:hypothetical protein